MWEPSVATAVAVARSEGTVGSSIPACIIIKTLKLYKKKTRIQINLKNMT
jgi:hypothetical protein